MGRRYSLGRNWAAGQDGDLRRKRAIVERHVRAVDPFNLAMLADQQRRLTSAIDEQVTRQFVAAAQQHRRDIAIGARAGANHLRTDMTHAQPPGGRNPGSRCR